MLVPSLSPNTITIGSHMASAGLLQWGRRHGFVGTLQVRPLSATKLQIIVFGPESASLKSVYLDSLPLIDEQSLKELKDCSSEHRSCPSLATPISRLLFPSSYISFVTEDFEHEAFADEALVSFLILFESSFVKIFEFEADFPVENLTTASISAYAQSLLPSALAAFLLGKREMAVVLGEPTLNDAPELLNMLQHSVSMKGVDPPWYFRVFRRVGGNSEMRRFIIGFFLISLLFVLSGCFYLFKTSLPPGLRPSLSSSVRYQRLSASRPTFARFSQRMAVESTVASPHESEAVIGKKTELD